MFSLKGIFYYNLMSQFFIELPNMFFLKNTYFNDDES
jgi:hypothetical protein